VKPKVTMKGGHPTPNGKLWQYECGCIEGFHPYHLYPCAKHCQPSLWVRLRKIAREALS
jgi:hypothetical protein